MTQNLTGCTNYILNLHNQLGSLCACGIYKRTLRAPRKENALVLIVKVKVTQSCPTLCDSMDYIDHGILQARILEWVAIPFSRGSSQPRSPTLQADSLPAEPQGRPRGCLLALWYRSRKRRFVPQEPLTCHVQPLIKGGYRLSTMTIAVKQASDFVRRTKSTNDR